MSVNSCCNGAKVGRCIGYVVSGALVLVVVVASPALAVIAALFFGLKAGYHAVLARRHNNETVDANGKTIVARMQEKGGISLQLDDRPRIPHALSHFEHVMKYERSKKLCRMAAKCIIPYVGLIWSKKTENGWYPVDPDDPLSSRNNISYAWGVADMQCMLLSSKLRQLDMEAGTN